VASDSIGGVGGDLVVVTAEEAARDSVGGADGDPVVAMAGKTSSDSTGVAGGDPAVFAAGEAGTSVAVGGRRRWRSGGSRVGGGVGCLGGRRRRSWRRSGSGRARKGGR